MKSTVYPDHPRASAALYRHLYCTENEETPRTSWQRGCDDPCQTLSVEPPA